MAPGPLSWRSGGPLRGRPGDPEPGQRRTLARLLRSIAPTRWGRACGLDPRLSLAEFATFPATGDAEVRPFVERIIEGDRRAMTAAGAVALVRTTGTTGPARLLPVTEAHRTDLLAFARRVFVRQIRMRPHPLPRFSRWLLVTASTETVDVGGLPAGYVSGLFQDALRRARPAVALPDPDIASVEDRAARLDRLVAVARGARVGVLFGVPADLVLLLERLTDQGGRPAGEIWPALEEVYWTGSHLGPAGVRIEQLVGRPLAFREVYGGAEGALGADWRGDGRLALTADRVVFAFDPVGGGRRRLLHELADARVGARFEILVTNAAGLVHYRIGDVVEVTGRAPLTLAVAGRVGEGLSLAGEALVAREAHAALAALAAERRLGLADWLVAPAPGGEAGGPPRHRWVVEVSASIVALPPDPAGVLDRALRRLSPAYAEARGAGRLAPPEVLLLPRGSFDRYREAAWAPGGPVKVRPFAATWAEALARPGLAGALARSGRVG